MTENKFYKNAKTYNITLNKPPTSPLISVQLTQLNQAKLLNKFKPSYSINSSQVTQLN